MRSLLAPADAASANDLVEAEIAKGAGLSVVRLLENLVHTACASRASDIHLDPGGSGVAVRLRIDGVLEDRHTFPLAIHHEVIARLKILSQMRTDEHQAAQDGRFRMDLGGGSVDVRVSIVPTYHGENAVLRLLAEGQEEFTLEALGFTKENQERILHAIRQPHGMILATGPTGSGKTTTLYTLVKMLQAKEVSIITIEDPIEYSIQGINQIQVNPRSDLTFANGLRSMLRQDPNIIMVGEIRDIETAGLAVNTALTGHLILSTLHTNDASTTLPRLLDMKVEPYLIASTVNIAISQRLVRRICPSCKAEKQISEAEHKSLSMALPEGSLAKDTPFYYGKGCERCLGSGYHGRIGIHEVMTLGTALRDAVLRKASVREIREIAIKEGMQPIINDGFRKAEQGMTTIEEVLRMRYE